MSHLPRLSRLAFLIVSIAVVSVDPAAIAFPNANPIVMFSDCNGNGIDDATDVAGATSEDCNASGFPDECDLGGNLNPPGSTRPAYLNSNALTETREDFDQQVAISDSGVAVAVWTSYGDAADPLGDDWDILFARSTDSGQTWSSPAPLNGTAATDLGDDQLAHLATDGRGSWIAAWQSTESLGRTIGRDRDILFARSTDDGLTWSWPVPLNGTAPTDSGQDEWIRVATDGRGTWVAVWVATDLDGTIGTDGDILIATSTDAGQTWSYPRALNTNAGTDSEVDGDAKIGTDGKGNWLVAWSSLDTLSGTIGEDWDILCARSFDNGATWSPPSPLNPGADADSDHDTGIDIATDGQGNWVAAWETSLPVRILTSRSADLGTTWTDPVVVLNSGGIESTDASLGADGRGHWLLTWASSDNLGGVLGYGMDILFAQSFDSGATWTTPAALHADAVSVPRADLTPVVSVDGLGNWNVSSAARNHAGSVTPDSNILFTRSRIGESEDCNVNGTPDECERDCDGDGVIDACDVCGDLDGDDDVDGDDYAVFLSTFAQGEGDAGYVACADLDDDGIVGLNDYRAWRTCYQGLVGDLEMFPAPVVNDAPQMRRRATIAH